MITLEPPRSLAGEARPWQKLGLSRPGLVRFLNRARAAVGLAGEVHVLLTGDATLRRLNRTFRGKNKATDVLSFPAVESGLGVAGDLAISLETAARQAVRFGHSLRDEVRVLLLHGILHLAGFDHEKDAGEMAAREAELRRELGVETGLIARVSRNATTIKADSSATPPPQASSPGTPDALRNDKQKNKQQQRRNAGVLRLRAASPQRTSSLGTPIARSAQDDSIKKRVRA
jgi:probable rRNA maturation factor